MASLGLYNLFDDECIKRKINLFFQARQIIHLLFSFSLLTTLAMPPPCKDKHKYCKYWAARGECHIKALYMIKHCQQSCNLCRSTGLYETSKLLTFVSAYSQCTKCSDSLVRVSEARVKAETRVRKGDSSLAGVRLF